MADSWRRYSTNLFADEALRIIDRHNAPYFVLIVLVRLAMSHPRGCPYLNCLNRKAGMSMDAPLEAERFVGSEVHG
jgi:hypothetical protein